MDTIAAQVHAFLFAEGGSLTYKVLSKMLGVDEVQVLAALEVLEKKLEGTGLALVRTEHDVALAASAQASDVLRAQYEKELAKDIGPAGLEVLAIVLYRGPSTHATIDYIRGVNTSSTIRLLLSRGLVERVSNPNDAREYLYQATTELLAHLGVHAVSELPDHATIASELKAFEQTNHESVFGSQS